MKKIWKRCTTPIIKSRSIKIDYVDREGTEQLYFVQVTPIKPKRQTKRIFDVATVRVKLEVWACCTVKGEWFITADRSEADSWQNDDKLKIIPLYRIIEDG